MVVFRLKKRNDLEQQAKGKQQQVIVQRSKYTLQSKVDKCQTNKQQLNAHGYTYLNYC